MNMIQNVWFDDAATSAMGEAFDQKSKRFAVWGPTERSAHMATDQISFYDESKETDRGHLHIGWQVNPYPFRIRQ